MSETERKKLNKIKEEVELLQEDIKQLRNTFWLAIKKNKEGDGNGRESS